jgi:hypothetical protein
LKGIRGSAEERRSHTRWGDVSLRGLLLYIVHSELNIIAWKQQASIVQPGPEAISDSCRQDWLPWARCNLRRNPFGELTRQERAELAVVDVHAITQWLDRPRRALQFIGDCGRGKTTRMLKLANQLAGAVYVYLPNAAPCPVIPCGTTLLIDEAQRLPRAVRRMVFETGLPLVLATHRDLHRSLRRYGYEVVTEQIGEGNTPELLCCLLNRRIEASRLHPGPVPVLSDADASWLVERFGSDFRGIESYLYEHLQSQVVKHGEMRFID